MWSLWWVWIIGAIVLGFIEVLIPAQIFLGFAFGAAMTGGLLAFDAFGMSQSLPLTLLLFAMLSLASWVLTRRVLGVRPGQVKTFDRDINED